MRQVWQGIRLQVLQGQAPEVHTLRRPRRPEVSLQHVHEVTRTTAANVHAIYPKTFILRTSLKFFPVGQEDIHSFRMDLHPETGAFQFRLRSSFIFM